MRAHVPFSDATVMIASNLSSIRDARSRPRLREEPCRQHEPCVLGTTRDADVAEKMLENRQRDVSKLYG
jgi:hypothetical protein